MLEMQFNWNVKKVQVIFVIFIIQSIMNNLMRENKIIMNDKECDVHHHTQGVLCYDEIISYNFLEIMLGMCHDSVAGIILL